MRNFGYDISEGKQSGRETVVEIGGIVSNLVR
jgi:1-aminocyclopropane-1-carboxylate deaminase/D-cysteine desulfhydrase-like pyridoxal-dependent ACC family enzyme